MTTMMNFSLRSWLIGPKHPILPLTTRKMMQQQQPQIQTQTQQLSVKSSTNRLAIDYFADTAEKGQIVPACYVRIHESVTV